MRRSRSISAHVFALALFTFGAQTACAVRSDDDGSDDADVAAMSVETQCNPGWTYCGEHVKVRAARGAAGLPTTDLYACNADRTVTRVETCAAGCEVRSTAENDACRPGESTVQAGGAARIEGVPQFAQGDPRWGAAPYLGGTACTMATCGCTLTALTMSANWAASDPSITPACINRSYGYALQIVRESVPLGDALGIPLTRIDESTGYHLLPVDPDPRNAGDPERRLLEAIRQSIRGGSPVILGMKIDYFGGGWSRHSTVAVAVDADGDLLLNDPATGGVTWFSVYRSGEKGPFRGYDRADAVRRPSSLPGYDPCP